MTNIPERQIRALHDDRTIRVYQAYNDQIADAALDITRDGFEWALAHGCPSHPAPGMSREDWDALKDASSVRVQWDPERDLHHNPLPHRAIQIGLGPEAVRPYVESWIQRVTDVTPLAHDICAMVREGRLDEARKALPCETIYR